jgi:V/A-type H+-transporting ATPase subunit I
MTLRPIPARWFELITVHDDVVNAMERLSRTGAVELEKSSRFAELFLAPDLERRLKDYRELASHYRAYWPTPVAKPKRPPESALRMLDSACRRLAAWRVKADVIIGPLECKLRRAAELNYLREALNYVGDDFPAPQLLAGAGPRLRARLVLLPAGATLDQPSARILFHGWQSSTANYILALGLLADIDQFEAQVLNVEGRFIPLPAWLPPQLTEAKRVISERLSCLEKENDALRGKLAALSARLQLSHALADIAILEWLTRNASELRGSGRLVWITGWTNDLGGTVLRKALDQVGVRYALRISDAPVGAEPPMLLGNPYWVRIFEMFARLLGVPARHEADPSLIVATLAPLMFGFMFGDVGQGLVLLAVGLIFGRRVTFLKILVPGGLAAMGFGLLFGSVFCREDIIPALWIRPLVEPVALLIAALSIGVAVLSIGMALDAAQEYWRGAARRWWQSKAGLSVAYFGLILSPIWAESLILVALGAVWYILGSAMFAQEGRLSVGLRGAAEFVEQCLRLLVNTVSFARIGAFALAHSALSAVVVSFAQASGPVAYGLALAFGNLFIVAVEGLVVSVQATRLMLFEFFVRFFTAKGRDFDPLSSPHVSDANSLRGAS